MRKNSYHTPRVEIFQLVEKDSVLQTESGTVSKTNPIDKGHRGQSKEDFSWNDDNATATRTYYNVWEE